MRAISCAFAFLMVASVARAQVNLPQAQEGPETMAKACRFMLSMSKDKYLLDNVRSFLNLAEEGGMESHAELGVQNMGDGVSIAALKITDPNDLLKPEFAKAYLKMARAAFSRPEITVCAEDKSPQVTLFLLGYLREKVNDRDLQDQIDSVKQFIRDQTKAAAASPAEPKSPKQ